MTNTGEILFEVRDRLAEWMQERGYGSNVYIVEAPIDDMVGQYAVQIVPGPDTAAHPNSGVGLIRTNVDMVVWWRGMADPVMRGTYRIAGAEGIQQFADVLREWLVQRTFGGRMVVPMTFRNGGTVQAVPELEGWLTLKDTYEFGYEMDWEVK
jgi:hypothetical protein